MLIGFRKGKDMLNGAGVGWNDAPINFHSRGLGSSGGGEVEKKGGARGLFPP